MLCHYGLLQLTIVVIVSTVTEIIIKLRRQPFVIVTNHTALRISRCILVYTALLGQNRVAVV